MVEQWKARQLEAIRWGDGEVIVSASAGTGKTSVIIERAWELVRDRKANIDEILIVTFTDDAAEQLKTKFHKRLDEELGKVDQGSLRGYLRDQLQRLDRAQISTIHSFCRRVVRENYHRLGISSEVEVIPPEQAELLKHRILDEIFEGCYADSGEFGERFRKLVGQYGGRGVDEGLGGTILSLHSFLGSLARPKEWLTRIRQMIELYRAADFSVTQLAVWEILKSAWLKKLEEFSKQLNTSRQAVFGHGGVKLGDYLDSLVDVVERRRKWLLEGRAAEILREMEESLPRSPAVKKDSPENEWWGDVREDVDLVKDGLKEWPREIGMALSGQEKVLREQAEFLETLLELVTRFSHAFGEEKEKEGRLEFDDLQRLALLVLEGGEEKRAEQAPPLQDRQYKYVLVDEYQDINELQDTIIRLAESGNLFMVGDVKQSIYRFRLAEPEIFQRLYRMGKPGGEGGLGRIDLLDNFRSRREVIEAVNAVFTPILRGGELELEYTEGSRLVYASNYPPVNCDLSAELHILERRMELGEEEDADENEIVEMESVEREAFVTARRIRELLDSGFTITAGGQTRAVREEDIVILFRSVRNTAGIYISMLRRMGLRAYCEQIEAFLEYPEIADIVSLLKVLDNPFGDISLATVLRSPLVGADLTELAKIRLGEKGYLFSGLMKFVKEHADDPSAEKFARFLERYETWRRSAGCCSVAELVQEIYLETSYPDYVRAGMPGQHGGENLDQFLKLAWQFSADGRCDLPQFLNYLDLMGEQSKAISGVGGGGGQGIKIQTIHGSKGLEYPVVVLGNLGKKVNFQDIRGDILIDRELGVGMKDVDPVSMSRSETLGSLVIGKSIRNKTIAEEMRLLYVAMTRAKEKLILVGSAYLESLMKGLTRINWEEGLTAGKVARWDTPLGWVCLAMASGEDGLHKMQDVLGSSAERTVQCGPFKITSYPSWDKVSGFEFRISSREKKREEVAVPATAKQEIQKIMEQLEWIYPWEEDVTLPPSVSVTNLVNMAEEHFQTFLPVSERGNLGLEKGRAWHGFMEKLDLHRPMERGELHQQLEEMVAGKILTRAQGELIDLEKVERFFQSRPGKMMLEYRDRLYRELAFTYSLAAKEFPQKARLGQTAEPVLIQGVADCLIRTNEGFVIVDYKTNRIEASEVDRMVEHYRIQIELYSKAISEIVGGRIASTWLYFTEPDSAVQVG
ncbi:MAG: helicase-exonuclease AddAB subunit AddA [Phycisphaerae bacterium]